MPKLRTWGATAVLAAGFSMGMAGGCDVTPPSALDAGLFVEPAVGEAAPRPCSTDADCDDGNSCTVDVCVTKGQKKTCQNTKQPSGFACDDGNVCTVGDTCDKRGNCLSGTTAAPAGTACIATNQCQGASCGFCQGTTCEPRFGPSVQYAAGTSPVSVAIGKLNADAFLDLAVADSGSHQVSVLLNNGDGTFGAPTTVNVGTMANEPRSVAVGDLNNDNATALDLAVANSAENSVSVLVNNGAGAFTVTQTIPVGTFPDSVAVADFNGTNGPDIVAANHNSSTVSVLSNNGTGTFTVTQTVIVGSGPASVAVGDFDGTLGPDIVTANDNNSTVSVLSNNGSGTFTVTQTKSVSPGITPESVAVGDFDGIQGPDIVTANVNSANVSVLLRNADGTFQDAHTYSAGTNPTAVAVGDFDSDGHLDLVVANSGSNNVSVLMGNGDGTFQAALNFPADGTSAPGSVAVGLLDADSHPDFVTTDFNIGDVSVFINNTP